MSRKIIIPGLDSDFGDSEVVQMAREAKEALGDSFVGFKVIIVKESAVYPSNIRSSVVDGYQLVKVEVLSNNNNDTSITVETFSINQDAECYLRANGLKELLTEYGKVEFVVEEY